MTLPINQAPSKGELDNCTKLLVQISKNVDKKINVKEFSKLFQIIDEIHFKRKRILNREKHKNYKEIMYNSGTCKERENSRVRYLNKLDGANLQLPIEPSQAVEAVKISKFEIYCHICKMPYNQVHHHYFSLCPKCAEFNYAKRFVTADLSGKTALVTGGRVKIGFEIAKKLLRCNCEVIVTTRFPEDALRRFEIEEDYKNWKHNLTIVYLDLINFHQVLQFSQWIQSAFKKLDILIMNAAQTVSREKVFYANVLQDYSNGNHILKWDSSQGLYQEKAALQFNSISTLDNANNFLEFNQNQISFNNNDQDKSTEVQKFEEKGTVLDTSKLELDEDHQFKEYREKNTWTERLDDFNMKDFLSCLVINLYSPSCLLQLLTPMLKRKEQHAENFKDFSFVVLVSAVEGMFKINTKSPCHPHTNAAKAGLNMFTRTSASDYKSRFNILINSVDTGFITVETINSKQFVPPLDNVDGMARVLHPVFEAVNKNKLVWGKMQKNFRNVDF